MNFFHKSHNSAAPVMQQSTFLDMLQHTMENAQESIDSTPSTSNPDHVGFLTKHLSFRNTPKRLATAYQDVTKAQSTSTEKIFLDAGGFSAWFAYFLTKRAANSTTHFDGQAACIQQLGTIDALSPEERLQLAQQVQQAIPSDTQNKFNGVFDKVAKRNQDSLSVIPQKRRCKYLVLTYYPLSNIVWHRRRRWSTGCPHA